MSGEPVTPVYRRHFVAIAGSIATSVGLAGCSGGGGGSDDGGENGGGESGSGGSAGGGGESGGGSGGSTGGGSGEGGGGSSTDLSTEIESMGSVAENGFDGAEVVGLQSFEAQDHSMAPDGTFVVTITLRNTGETDLDPLGPDYTLTPYGGDDSVLNDGPNQNTSAVIRAYDAAPGELTGVDAYSSQVEYGAVARYEVALA